MGTPWLRPFARHPSGSTVAEASTPELPRISADCSMASRTPGSTLKSLARGHLRRSWYLAGGTHRSVLVEMKDYLVVVEGPQNDDRAVAVIEEVKRLVPNKPIKYVVNSHHHFDHAGGLGAFVAGGATVITHAINKPFFEQAFAAPRTINPDKLAQSGKKAVIETLDDKLVLRDETRTLELHHIKDNAHDDGLIMAYLPQEKLLIEADAYTPPAPNTPYPAQANPFSVNLAGNIERLQLQVEQILPLHGRIVPLAELMKAIGRAS
jgi:glyoxylase-like metal-dependent hydrolase (beta-lactamase superfamily II)